MAGRIPDPRQICLKFDDWPAADQTLWTEATTPRAPSFKGKPYAQRLAPPTIAKAQEGYGRFLGFLSLRAPDDLLLPPEHRVTRDNAEGFLALMLEVGNRDHTIVGRFQELQTALRIMLPCGAWGWLTNPDGWSLRSSFLMQRRPMVVHTPITLKGWAMALAEEALAVPNPVKSALQTRDALMIAILAHRAIRLRSLSLMQLGRHLQPVDGGWRMTFEAAEMKNRKPIQYGLPPSLTPLIDRYLFLARPLLMAGSASDCLWIDLSGAQMRPTQIKSMIRARSLRQFGTAFGPHAFRHCLNTGAKLADPGHPGLGAAVLGISEAVGNRHYDLATSVQAAAQFHQALALARGHSPDFSQEFQ